MPTFVRSLAVVTLATALTACSVAHADVVFGNLGASGTGSLGGTNTDYGPADTVETKLAQGFTVGSGASLLQVQSITLGLFYDNFTTASRTVSIYSNVSGEPGTSLFTSAPTTVGSNAKYTFNFSGATLTPGSSYWIVPEGPASWYFNNPATAPVEQNGSGFTYLGTKRLDFADQIWLDQGFTFYSTSVVAVPEPPAIVLSGIGIASALYAMRRRHG